MPSLQNLFKQLTGQGSLSFCPEIPLGGAGSYSYNPYSTQGCVLIWGCGVYFTHVRLTQLHKIDGKQHVLGSR